MVKGKKAVMAWWIVLILLGTSVAYAEENVPQEVPSQPEKASGRKASAIVNLRKGMDNTHDGEQEPSKVAPSQPEEAPDEKGPVKEYIPLIDVIHQYSERTETLVKLSQKLQTDTKAMNQLYSSQNDSWLEYFSRVEYVNKETGKKEIILMRSLVDNGAGTVQTPPSTSVNKKKRPRKRVRTAKRPPRRKVPQDSREDEDEDEKQAKQEGQLSREQLVKLTRFPVRPPYPVELLEDRGHRNFFRDLGIHSEDDLPRRGIAMKIRKKARLQLRLLRRK
jgi:hypothetical protein